MNIQKGLRPLPEDNRDFQTGAFFTLPSLEELPKEFSLGDPIWIGNQNAAGEGDFCSAYATCGMSQYQEGIELYPAFSFAAGKAISGDPDEWGQNIRTACKAHVKHGAAYTTSVPGMVTDADPQLRRDFSLYPTVLRAQALNQKKKTYWKVTGPYDSYDNFRATISKLNVAIGFGIKWQWPLEQYKLDTMGDGFGHMMYAIGWEEDGLLVVNSIVGLYT